MLCKCVFSHEVWFKALRRAGWQHPTQHENQRIPSVKVTYVGADVNTLLHFGSVGDKLADVNTINFIGRGEVHTKLMVVTTTLVAPTNISPNRDYTADENRSCWIRTYLSALPHYRA
jgi:hypothetical protein